MTGSGTPLDPYIIWDATDLQNMNLGLAAYYELGVDIDATITSTWNGGAGFIPIGTAAPHFTGYLDGKGFTITNLFINRPATDYIGFFARCPGATINDFILEDVDITGQDYTGALCGYSSASTTWDDIEVSGTVLGRGSVGGAVGYAVTATAFNNCNSSCSVTSQGAAAPGTDDHCGGFVGITSTNVIFNECYATGSVTGETQQIGGFVGVSLAASDAFTKCYATGAVVTGKDGANRSTAGGFVGWANGTFTDCYAKGSVTGTGNYVGGFAGVSGDEDNCYSTGFVTGVGADIGGFNADLGGTTTDCFWDLDTSGQIVSDGGTGKTTLEMKDIVTFNNAGWDMSAIWGLFPLCNSGYPCLRNVTPSCSVTAPLLPPLKIPALEALRNIEMSAAGRVYVDETGDLKYENRYARNP